MIDYKVKVKHIITELHIPHGRFVLAGSGVMVMHGMDREPRDLDIFTTTRQWFGMMKELTWAAGGTLTSLWNLWTPEPDDHVARCDPPYLYRRMHDLDVTVYFHWRQRGVGDIDGNFWIHNAEVVDGIPCLPLPMLLAWKESMGRAKDAVDIVSIRGFLEGSHGR
jgi:hypothetical protein